MKKSFIIGTVVSAAAGLIAGVLAAPKSGKQTRADLKTKAEELKSDASEKTEKAKSKLSRNKDSTEE